MNKNWQIQMNAVIQNTNQNERRRKAKLARPDSAIPLQERPFLSFDL
jgi:hypothetical protein